jgi:hypothetical protein
MSPANEIESICFRPPLAIGRVGGGDTRLDAFAWDSDHTIHGSHQTIIRPAISLQKREQRCSEFTGELAQGIAAAVKKCTGIAFFRIRNSLV